MKLFLCPLIILILFAIIETKSLLSSGNRKMKWVTMWGNAQSTVMPSPAKYAKNITLRYPIFSPFDGNKIRVTLDNYCIDEEVSIDYIIVSKGTKLSDEQISNFEYLSFNGRKGVTIKPHGYVVSDELGFDLKSDEYLIISIYIRSFVNLSGGVDIIGPLSKGYFAYGDQAKDTKLNINTSMATSWVYFLSNVDIYTDEKNKAIICYGDSITSQDWPDEMMLELRRKNIKNISIVRKAVRIKKKKY